MSRAPYGCHNREPYRAELVVQDGWYFREGADTRIPRMVRIPFRNRPDCSYKDTDLGKADPRCAGCSWREQKAEHA